MLTMTGPKADAALALLAERCKILLAGAEGMETPEGAKLREDLRVAIAAAADESETSVGTATSVLHALHEKNCDSHP